MIALTFDTPTDFVFSSRLIRNRSFFIDWQKRKMVVNSGGSSLFKAGGLQIRLFRNVV